MAALFKHAVKLALSAWLAAQAGRRLCPVRPAPQSSSPPMLVIDWRRACGAVPVPPLF